jgi:hypothetical protein
MKKFEDLFREIEENQEIKKLWQEAKDEQKRMNKIGGTIAIITIGLAFIAMIVLIRRISRSPNMIFNLFFVGQFLFLIIFIDLIVLIITNTINKRKNIYKLNFKKLIIKKIMSNFYDNLEYYPDKQIPTRIYKEARYNEFYNRYYSEDYLEGQIKNRYYIDMAEVLTQHFDTERDSNGKIHTTTTTIFHGLFAKVTAEKSIKSELRVVQNGVGKFDKNRLNMDSSEFEKYFDVITDNKIIAMQLLTADVMEEMIEFENKTNIKYDIVIKENEIYLRFHCGSMFEPQALKKGIINKEQLERYFYMLNFTYNLSNRLIELINETEI